ncbi:MAG: DUF3857 domain-containing protein [Puia sp.]|nr:DUF3857 domain-containing protein [Puia sp.]
MRNTTPPTNPQKYPFRKSFRLAILLATVTMLRSAAAYSQSASATPPAPAPAIVKEQWSPAPTLHTLDPKYASESAVIILDKRRLEYVDEEKNNLAVYKTLHKIIRVNDDNGIESYNRVYLGVTDNSDIVDIRARTILPNGKIIEVDKSNIKDLKEDDGNMYKIFAMEGLEKGCELEYYYTFKRPASYFGREVLQGRNPVLDSRLEIFAPERLIFETRGYNYTAGHTDTILNNKRIISTEQENIPGVEQEKYAAYDANLRRLEYKLAYNTANNKNERLFTWNELAKRMYSIYTSYTGKELDKIDNLISDRKWDRLGSEREKIIAVENYLKKNIATREDINTEDAENIEKILKNRIASYRGIVRLYGAVFDKLGIGHQFGLTCNRNESLIDKSFENWNNLDNPVIYFPASKKLLAPTSLDSRYPWINPLWGASNALFCKSTTIGNFTTAFAEIRTVPLEDYTQTFNNIESGVQFNTGLDTVLVDMKQIYGGYSAAYYRAGFTFSSEDERHRLLKDLVKFGTNSESIVSSEVENADFESYSDNKPFILHASVKASELMERAGKKILLKIGDIIGPQTEMYQEKARQFPMSLAYPHLEDRKIRLTVPEGYTVKNLDDLNIKNVFTDNGEPTMGFTSSYTQQGNVVEIHVLEEYRKIFYPLSQYEDFRKIINASADFNKVVLVLEKK